MIRRPCVESPVAHLIGPGQIRIVNRRLTYITPERYDLRLDVARLQAVFCYGGISFSDEALRQLLENDVEVSLLSRHGQRCYGRLSGNKTSSTRLRMMQHRWFQDAAFRLELARHWVAAKIVSQRDAARGLQRRGVPEAGSLLRQLDSFHDKIPLTDNGDALRGLEGAATAAWFGLWGQQLRRPWEFETRNRRPPKDPVNALLSLAYTWLTNRAASRALAEGFELNLGTLHEFRAGRPSLACDVVEPLRVPAVDRWVLSELNQNKLSPGDFESRDGGVYLVKGVFSSTLGAFEEHWAAAQMDKMLDQQIRHLTERLRRREAAENGVDH